MPDSRGRPKAADISDEAMLIAIRDGYAAGRALTWWDLAERFPQFPPKVVQAKLRALDSRKLADGCPDCGCSSWYVTPAGRDRIAVHA